MFIKDNDTILFVKKGKNPINNRGDVIIKIKMY